MGTPAVVDFLRNRVRQNLCRLLARSTQSLRRSLGLVGYKVKIAERDQSQMAHPFQDEIQFDAITDEFRDTYYYLNRLFEDAQIKPNDHS